MILGWDREHKDRTTNLLKNFNGQLEHFTDVVHRQLQRPQSRTNRSIYQPQHYKLLRCSTQLKGHTESTRKENVPDTILRIKKPCHKKTKTEWPERQSSSCNSNPIRYSNTNKYRRKVSERSTVLKRPIELRSKSLSQKEGEFIKQNTVAFEKGQNRRIKKRDMYLAIFGAKNMNKVQHLPGESFNDSLY